MESISSARRSELLFGARDVLKIELKDDYGSDAGLLAAWRAGDRSAVDEAQAAFGRQMAEQVAKGWSFRRVRVVSEPLSDYQRMAVATCTPSVEAGGQLRWLPRRLVCTLPLPGNDCFVLDEEAVVFHVHDGEDMVTEILYSEDPEAVKFCRDAFNAAWALATPHHDYDPA